MLVTAERDTKPRWQGVAIQYERGGGDWKVVTWKMSTSLFIPWDHQPAPPERSQRADCALGETCNTTAPHLYSLTGSRLNRSYILRTASLLIWSRTTLGNASISLLFVYNGAVATIHLCPLGALVVTCHTVGSCAGVPERRKCKIQGTSMSMNRKG